jgi:hypothetical protein
MATARDNLTPPPSAEKVVTDKNAIELLRGIHANFREAYIRQGGPIKEDVFQKIDRVSLSSPLPSCLTAR